jgi:hypothetical protein
MPGDYGILQICGKYYETDDPDIKRYWFFYPQEIKLQP